MRRHEAKDLVYQNHYTAGQLKEHLLDNMDLADNSKSRLNPQFTRGEIWKILYNGMSQHPDDFVVDSGHPTLVLAAANILREFGIPTT